MCLISAYFMFFSINKVVHIRMEKFENTRKREKKTTYNPMTQRQSLFFGGLRG